MEAVDFKERNVIVGKGQKEYRPLPAFYNKQNTCLTFCFELNDAEKAMLAKTGKIWVRQWTFNRPMHPISLSVRKEDLM